MGRWRGKIAGWIRIVLSDANSRNLVSCQDKKDIDRCMKHFHSSLLLSIFVFCISSIVSFSCRPASSSSICRSHSWSSSMASGLTRSDSSQTASICSSTARVCSLVSLHRYAEMFFSQSALQKMFESFR